MRARVLPKPSELLTTKQAAEILGVSEASLRRDVARGMPAYKLGSTKQAKLRLVLSEVTAWRSRQRRPPSDEIEDLVGIGHVGCWDNVYDEGSRIASDLVRRYGEAIPAIPIGEDPATSLVRAERDQRWRFEHHSEAVKRQERLTLLQSRRLEELSVTPDFRVTIRERTPSPAVETTAEDIRLYVETYGGEVTEDDICASYKISEKTLREMTGRLRELGVVRVRRSGRPITYRLRA